MNKNNTNSFSQRGKAHCCKTAQSLVLLCKVLLFAFGLVFFPACKHEISTSNLPEMKILVFPNGLTDTSTGTGSSASCVIGTGVIGTCKVQ
ncbi:MAG: hypothetical protein IT569_10450 [Leptospiraceae bacterium]|nr:hypothetical protein [Leptospiraceae bacterium]